jgi:hypothetical protein
LLNGPDYKLGEFSRKRSKAEFFVGYTAIQEAKDYNFFEHPYHKYTNFPKDSEKFYQRNFEDFVEMDCYEEDLLEPKIGFIQFVDNPQDYEIMKINEEFLKKNRDRRSTLRRRNRFITKYSYEVAKAQKEDKMIMENSDPIYWKFLDEFRKELEVRSMAKKRDGMGGEAVVEVEIE